jgi:uncharacterized protein YukJ
MTHHRTKPHGARRQYGVIVGTIVDGRENPGGASPHYEIWVQAAETNYRLAVNVRSVDGSDVMAFFDPTYIAPPTLDLAGLAGGPAGFQAVQTGPDGQGLDYIRGNLFLLDRMAQIPPDGAGVTLSNLLDGQVERAKADAGTVLVAFGEFFQDPGSDATFGFSPERGLHDIHMMQGNSGSFADDNRVRGDGALFIRFASAETVALFVRFTVQSTQTDDQTGAPD